MINDPDAVEERIRDIADNVLGIQPADVATIVLLDAIERCCVDERIAARQAATLRPCKPGKGAANEW